VLECSPSELSLVEKAEEFKFPTFLKFVVYSRGFNATKMNSSEMRKSPQPVHKQRHMQRSLQGKGLFQIGNQVFSILYSYRKSEKAVADPGAYALLF
jgi:hypothetical protein